MNNISFGKVIFPPMYKDRTLKQIAVQDVIDNVFNNQYRPKQSASTIVHNKLRADILVTNLKNGDTEIKFQKSASPKGRVFSDTYIAKKIGTFVVNHKDNLFEITGKLEEFADKCVDAAMRYR